MVLVAIGLLIGGVMAGRNLLRSGEVQSVISDYQEMQTAIRTFEDRYNYLPGDLPNATDYFTTPQNGDGDGTIERITAARNERFLAWDQLAESELIQGTYSGAEIGGDADAGVVPRNGAAGNIPPGALEFSGYYLNSNVDGTLEPYNSTIGNYLLMGRETATAPPQGGIITPAEANNIDRKIDDGNPGFGQVQGRRGQAECTGSANDPTAAAWELDEPNKVCALIFRYTTYTRCSPLC